MTYHYISPIAISISTNNNSTGSDGINIRHLKHLGPLAIRYLANLYNVALNTTQYPIFGNKPQSSPFQNQIKTTKFGTNYQPISLLSLIVKTLQKTLLPYITENILAISHQHGFKHKHSTHTALHNICHQIIKGFNNPRPPQHTVAVALDMSKVFYTVNIHKLLHKLTNKLS